MASLWCTLQEALAVGPRGGPAHEHTKKHRRLPRIIIVTHTRHTQRRRNGVFHRGSHLGETSFFHRSSTSIYKSMVQVTFKRFSTKGSTGRGPPIMIQEQFAVGRAVACSRSHTSI